MFPKFFGPVLKQLPLQFAVDVFAVECFDLRDATLIDAIHNGSNLVPHFSDWEGGVMLKGQDSPGDVHSGIMPESDRKVQVSSLSPAVSKRQLPPEP